MQFNGSSKVLGIYSKLQKKYRKVKDSFQMWTEGPLISL